MIARMGGMNDALNTLIKLAKEEVQRLAYNHFEIARDAFRRGLYQECLDELDKAINGDHVSPGYKLEWRFHQLQGVIRLGFFGCDTDLVDPARAEQSFLLAARYARSDDRQEAAKAFLSAGWSAFVQGKLPQALKHTDQAVSLDADLTEGLFQAAKFRMAAGEPDGALPMLRKAIDREPAFMVKASADGDFQRHVDDLNAFLEAMRQEQTKALSWKVRRALTDARKWAETLREVAEHHDILDGWQSLLDGKWGLMELIQYASEGFEKDRQTVEKAKKEGEKRLQQEHEHKKNSWHLEKRVQKVLRDVDEPYQVEETYEVEEPYQVEESYEADEPYEVEETYEVEEPYQVEGEYTEPVVVKRWFLPPKIKEVRRTRMVTKYRKVKKTRMVTKHRKVKKTHMVTKHRKVKKTRMVTKTRKVQREVEEDCHVLVNELGEYFDRFNFVRIPAGRFRMGSPESEEDRSSSEKRHEVIISRAFDMMTTPVTQSLWQAVMGKNPSHFKGPDRPVEEVSWYDVHLFIDKLNEALKTDAYRLPTEAEWEYACRAGTTGARYGDLDRIAWYEDNSDDETHPVGQKEPNAWGLYDMLGNVWEWCEDRHQYGSYPDGPVTDPKGPWSGSLRVDRGGSWNDNGRDCWSAFRGDGSPGDRYDCQGFRLCRSL